MTDDLHPTAADDSDGGWADTLDWDRQAEIAAMYERRPGVYHLPGGMTVEDADVRRARIETFGPDPLPPKLP